MTAPNPNTPITSSGKKLKTLVIKAGETGILPTKGHVLSVYRDGNATASSNCVTLPVPSAFKCYEIIWSIEFDSGGGTGPWNQGDMVIQELRVGDQVFTLNMVGDGGSNACNPQCSTLYKFIQANVPDSLMKLYAHDYDAVGEQHNNHLKFKAAPEVAANTYLKFGGQGGAKNTYAYAFECPTGCCPPDPIGT